MQHYAPVCIYVCFMLCLSFNYTFPLHRTEDHTTNASPNRYGRCSSSRATTRDALAVATITDERNTRHPHPGSSGNTNLSGDDLRHYEQMVIMKKYPYLDLKDLELKYHSSKTRHNARFAADFGNEPAICEPIEGPNVEIFNRGLSGFAIPQPVPQLKVTDARQADKEKSLVLNSLREDVKEFEEKINS